MTEMTKKFGILIAMAIVLSFAIPFSPNKSFAERYKVFGDKTLYSVGYLRQKLQVGIHKPEWESSAGLYQLDGAHEGVTSMVTTFYLENQLELTKNSELAFTFRWQGDSADWFNSGNTWDNGNALAWDEFDDNQDISYDDRLEDMIRECSYAHFSRFFSFRVGKQQLAWGEADGFRIMNGVMSLDMRKDFILLDSDEGYSETNIPLWMIKTDITPDFNFGQSLGFQNLDLELSWSPDTGNPNRFAIGPRNGGPWGFPLPDLPLPLTQLNTPDNWDHWDFSHGAYGARLKGIFHDIFFTLNGYYGWSNGLVFQHSGIPTGNVGFIFDPNFVGNVADAFSSDISGGFPPGFPAPFYGLSLTLTKSQMRRKFIGFTASREIPIKTIANALGQYTYPVIRVEALYDMDVAFNVGHDNASTAIFSDWLWVNTLEERDVYRYLIGFDWNLHCDFINPSDDVWLSAQFSQNRIRHGVYVDGGTPANPAFGYPGGEKQRLINAPYFWFPKKVETFTSLLLKSSYMNDDLHIQALWVHDWTTNTYWVKPKAKLEIGNNWICEVGYYTIHGKRENSMGIFSNNDSAYTQVTFQW